jgi:hypothetical protein
VPESGPKAEEVVEAPSESKPEEPSVPEKEEAPSPVAEAEPAPVVSSVAPEVVAKNAKALEALDGRLEDVLQRMGQIESELGNVKSSKETDTKQLEETIEALKAEIAELKNRPAPEVRDEKPAISKQAAKEEAEPAEEPVEEAEPPKPAPKKVQKPRPAPKAATASTNTRWELRAAQPGRAWVSRPGERDMQSVEVGQALGGIGQVTAILYQNGRWTVQGTQGQINQ